MEALVYFLTGLLIGGFAAWVIRKFMFEKKFVSKHLFDTLQAENLQQEGRILFLDEKVKDTIALNTKYEAELRQVNAEKDAIGIKHAEVNTTLQLLQQDTEDMKNTAEAEKKQLQELKDYILKIKSENEVLKEKNNVIKKEIEDLGAKYAEQFKNLANDILEDKSKKFTEENQKNIRQILDPLNKEITDFRKKVDETYEKENRQRFALEEKIKDLVQLNQRISEEASNLTKALKGQRKTQGDWGEMILENILQQSGLTEGREYVKQEFLRDNAGNTLINEEGKRMQPDFIIQYPDKRKIIIDSKVSLNAYERYCSSDDEAVQKQELENHLHAVYAHVDELSKRNYQQFTATLDFVIMFIPIEPAYLLAMQKDRELWLYAYKKRVLLISPTNLIAAVKLIAELWKKDEQNKNAIAIAERGAALYDKFVGFVENLEDVGAHLDKSQKSYGDAMKQLRDGNGNLIAQAEKLRKLGIQGKKNLPGNLLSEAGEEV
jgi:DNA recombination protein RmuC